MWSEATLTRIKEIKKAILKKKILLSIVIENYTRLNKIFKYLHMTIALSTPAISLFDSNVTLILSSIVAGMIKLKDYLKFDKIRELAKQQTIKYEQLYQRIERELNKKEDDRQIEDEFIYWITREFNHIELADPEVSHGIKKKFIDKCQELKIPYDEDIELLQILIKTDDQKHPDYKNTTQHLPENKDQVDKQDPIRQIASQPDTIQQSHSDSKSRSVSYISVCQEAPETKRDYQEKIKTYNVNNDLNLTLQRLNDL